MMSVYMKATVRLAPKDWPAVMSVYMKATLVWPLRTGQP